MSTLCLRHTDIQTRKRIVIFGLLSVLLLLSYLFLTFVIGLADNPEEELMRYMGQINAAKLVELFLNNPASSTLDDMAHSIIIMLQGLGIFLVFFYTVLAILKELNKGEATLEMWLRIFIKCAIGVALVIYVDDIVRGLEQLGYMIVISINDALFQTFESEYIFGNMFEGRDWNDLIWGTSYFTIGVATIIMIYIRVLSYSLFIELALRKAFTPVAIASIVTEGVRSPGFRWLKKILVVYFKMAIIILCTAIAYFLCIATNAGSLFDVLIFYLAAASFMGKGAAIADQIVGT